MAQQSTTTYSMDTLVHDKVNLLRIVSRLEEEISINQKTWGSSSLSAWIKATNAHHTLVYARQLLENVQLHEVNNGGPSSPILPDLQRTLDRLEPVVVEAQIRLAPPPKTRKSLLSSLPKPAARQGPHQYTSIGSPELNTLSTTEEAPPPAAIVEFASDLRFASIRDPNPQPPLVHTTSSIQNAPQEPSVSHSHTAGKNSPPVEDSASRFLTTSLKTQEELSAQLAQMATQLKMNAAHFTEALARDRAVMEGAEEKLEGNLTRVKSERGRLKVHSSKSGKTTWLVLGAILTVVIAWVVMFLLIRIT